MIMKYYRSQSSLWCYVNNNNCWIIHKCDGPDGHVRVFHRWRMCHSVTSYRNMILACSTLHQCFHALSMNMGGTPASRVRLWSRILRDFVGLEKYAWLHFVVFAIISIDFNKAEYKLLFNVENTIFFSILHFLNNRKKMQNEIILPNCF